MEKENRAVINPPEMPNNTTKKYTNQKIVNIFGQLGRWTDAHSGFVNQIWNEDFTNLESKVNHLFWVVYTYTKAQLELVNDFNTVVDNFNELYEFVKDYFDNLDVQEEINNKLDEMYEDGTLKAIIDNIFAALNQQIANLQRQIDDLIVESGNTDEEVIQARAHISGFNYGILSRRLQALDSGDALIDSSVKPEHLSFTNHINLFGGDYTSGFYVGGIAPDLFYAPSTANKVILVNIKPNTTYTVYREPLEDSDGNKRFKLATSSLTKWEFQNTTVLTSLDGIQYSNTSSGISSYTFTTRAEDRTLVMQMSDIFEPYVQVSEGSNPQRYNSYKESIKLINVGVDITKDDVDFIGANENITIFNGKFNTNLSLTGDDINTVVRNDSTRQLAVIKINAGQTYSITISGTDQVYNNRQFFKVSMSSEYSPVDGFRNFTRNFTIYSQNYYTFTAGSTEQYVYIQPFTQEYNGILQVRVGEHTGTTISSYDAYYNLIGVNVYSKNEVDEIIDNIDIETTKSFFRKISATRANVYIWHGKNRRYVNYTFEHSTDTTRNLNTWRLLQVQILDENLNPVFNFGSSGVEWEGAIKLSGASDFIGGDHGSESFNTINFNIDGQFINPSLNYDRIQINDYFEITVSSNLYQENTSTLAFTRGKQLTIDSFGTLTIDNVFIAKGNLTITEGALMMCSVNGLISNYGMRDYDYKPVSLVSGFGNLTEVKRGRDCGNKIEFYNVNNGISISCVTPRLNLDDKIKFNYGYYVEDFLDQANSRVKGYWKIYNYSTQLNEPLRSYLKIDIRP